MTFWGRFGSHTVHHREGNRWLQAYTLLEESAARLRLELTLSYIPSFYYSNVHSFGR